MLPHKRFPIDETVHERAVIGLAEVVVQDAAEQAQGFESAAVRGPAAEKPPRLEAVVDLVRARAER